MQISCTAHSSGSLLYSERMRARGGGREHQTLIRSIAVNEAEKEQASPSSSSSYSSSLFDSFVFLYTFHPLLPATKSFFLQLNLSPDSGGWKRR